jgi:hypothetical protein
VDTTGKEVVKVSNKSAGAKIAEDDQLEDISTTDYFKQASQSLFGQVAISDLFLGEVDDLKEPFLRYASPIYSNGKFNGVIVVLVRADYFLDDIRNFSRDGEEAFLVNSKGQYVANADKNKEFDQLAKYNFLLDYPDLAKFIEENPDERYFENSDYIFSFREIVPALNSFETYIGSLAFNQSTAENYWILVIVEDKSEISKSIWSITKEKVFIWVIETLIILLVSIILWKKCSK